MFTYLTKILYKGLKDHLHNAGIADVACAVHTWSSRSLPAVPKTQRLLKVSLDARAWWAAWGPNLAVLKQ